VVILFFLLVVRLNDLFFVDDFFDWLFDDDFLFVVVFFLGVVRFFLNNFLFVVVLFLGVVRFFLNNFLFVDDFFDWLFVDVFFLDWFFVDDFLLVVVFFLGVVVLFFLVVVVWVFNFFVLVHEDWFVTGLVITISTFEEGGHESFGLIVFGLEEGITDGTKCFGKAVELSAESISEIASSSILSGFEVICFAIKESVEPAEHFTSCITKVSPDLLNGFLVKLIFEVDLLGKFGGLGCIISVCDVVSLVGLLLLEDLGGLLDGTLQVLSSLGELSSHGCSDAFRCTCPLTGFGEQEVLERIGNAISVRCGGVKS
jgi:hypothetical protein